MEMQTNPQVVEVDDSNFESVVIQGSQERLVVVDFWAPWCGPCRTLGPILTEVVTSLGSGVVLAKINVDDNQQLAMAFGVQGIPAVKIVQDGQLVKEFTGALPKEEIEEILRPLVPESAGAAEEKADPLEQAEILAEMGDLDGAVRLYDEFLSGQPEDSKALLGLARVRQRQGDFDPMEALVGRVEQGSSEYKPAQSLLHLIGVVRTCREAGGFEACARKLQADPGDLDARYALGCCAAAGEDYSTALKEWLAIVERNKDFRDGAARDAMVSLFFLLGRHHQSVADYPQRLHRALY